MAHDAAVLTSRSERRTDPVRVGFDPIRNIHLFEDHDTAYDLWKAAAVRDRVLVHFDGHLDFEWMADHQVDELLEARSSQELDRLLTNVSAWHFDERPLRQRVNIANFIYPAIKEGLVGRFIWVMPDPFWASPRHRQVIRRGLEDKLRRRAQDAGPLHVSDTAMSFSVLDCHVVACTLANLPLVPEPVLLDIDVDYLLTTRPAGPAPYFRRQPERPWVWPREFFQRLQAARLQSDLVTVAYSVNDGYTPLRYKYFGDLVTGALRDASEPVSDAPRGRSAAEAFRQASLGLASGDVSTSRRWWREMARRDPSYRTVYALPGWREERAGRWRAALRVYDRMIPIDPQWHVTHLGRGRALWMLGRYAEAKTAFETALSLSTSTTSAGYWVGLCRFRLDDVEGARRAWNEAIRADPNDASSEYGLACLEARCGNATGAVWHARRSLVLGRSDSALHWLHNRMLRRGRYGDITHRRLRRWASQILRAGRTESRATQNKRTGRHGAANARTGRKADARSSIRLV